MAYLLPVTWRVCSCICITWTNQIYYLWKGWFICRINMVCIWNESFEWWLWEVHIFSSRAYIFQQTGYQYFHLFMILVIPIFSPLSKFYILYIMPFMNLVEICCVCRRIKKVVQSTMVLRADSFSTLRSNDLTWGLWEGMVLLSCPCTSFTTLRWFFQMLKLLFYCICLKSVSDFLQHALKL